MLIRSLLTGLGLSLLFSMISSPAALAQDMPEKAGERCLLTLSPSTISRQQEPVEIQTEFPLALGTIRSIEVEEASGLTALEPRAQESDSVSFALDSSRAEPGTWILVFRTDQGECRAVLKVS